MDSKDIRRKMMMDQQRAFCKQSCTKIDQGLDKLDPRSGERAIWELFQNARDLAQINETGNKEAHIKITLTPTEFVFAHQGRPFDDDSLSSLVMQVSSQGKENDDTVGQYGTGFLTTHVFGRKLNVTGSLDMSKYVMGKFVNIDNFVIDRTYDSISEFVDKVAEQLMNVNDFADAEKVDTCREWTELRYDLSSMEGAARNAAEAISSSVEIMPYVLTINKPIVDVRFENQLTGEVYVFEKKQLPDESGLKVMQVTINHNGCVEERKLYYLESEDGEDMAILPLASPTQARSLSGVAKLFVFFPLLGTEDFGMDVVFHSKKFIPVEARDGLHLPVSNVNVKAKYEKNVRVLNSLTEMVHNYLSAHCEDISDWVNVSKLTFDCEHHKEDVTKTFFCNLKETWSDFFEKLPMIELCDGRVSVANSPIRFFSKEIVNDCSEKGGDTAGYLKTVYDAAALNHQLAMYEEILHWSCVVASWNSSHKSLLGVEDIAKSLSDTTDVPVELLHAFDSYIAGKKQLSLFTTYDLIPNRDGVKMKANELRDASSIPGWLGEISKTLVADKVKMFANDTFVGIVTLPSFTRNDLRTAYTESLKTLRQNYLEKGRVYDVSVINALFKLSCIFPTETSSGIRRNSISVIGEHLQNEIDFRLLSPLDSDERDLAELPFKHLVENMLLEISQKDSEWVANNIDYIVNLHSVLASWTEYYNRNNQEGLCIKYGAIPNRNGVPCMFRDMENGIDIPNELSSLYQEVLGMDLNERLVDERFASFCEFKPLSAKDVAAEIESRLEENSFKHSSVLDIINNLSKDECWSRWFPHIASKKAELFLDQVQPDCKESIFKLMKVNDPEKLSQLADLSKEVNLDEIIEKGRASLIERKNKEADFNFKYELGKYVEGMIKQHLSDSCGIIDSGITVEPEQYGCDLSICKNGNPIYFIEVKSRWGREQSVMMSPLQMSMSVENSDNYALCCIDMSHLGHVEVEEHHYPSLNEVLPYIKVLSQIGSINKEVASIAEGKHQRLVYVGGDYKCVVPQSTIQEYGNEFSSLVNNIVSAL